MGSTCFVVVFEPGYYPCLPCSLEASLARHIVCNAGHSGGAADTTADSGTSKNPFASTRSIDAQSSCVSNANRHPRFNKVLATMAAAVRPKLQQPARVDKRRRPAQRDVIDFEQLWQRQSDGQRCLKSLDSRCVRTCCTVEDTTGKSWDSCYDPSYAL
jgi:hypothetical protein